MSSTSNATREPAAYTSPRDEHDAITGVMRQDSTVTGNVLTAGKDVESGDHFRCEPHTLQSPEDSPAAVARASRYRIAALVLMAIALLMTIGTLVAAAVVMWHCSIYHDPNSDSPALSVLLTWFMYILVVVESVLSLAATITLLALLACRPARVLLPPPHRSDKYTCLCLSLFVLFLFAAYSFATPIVLGATDQPPAEPMALCVIPGVRMVAFLAMFALVIAHRQGR